MKKHLLGLAVFSFIFASFAVAFAYFYAPAIRKVVEVRQPVFESDSRKKCDYSRKRDEESRTVKITQATLSEKNRQFRATVEGEELNAESEFTFHFFVNDGQKISYLTTKNSEAVRNYNIERPTAYIRFKLDEGKELYSKKNNFYVIAEVINENSKSTDKQQIFDSNKAFPILWAVDPISD